MQGCTKDDNGTDQVCSCILQVVETNYMYTQASQWQTDADMPADLVQKVRTTCG